MPGHLPNLDREALRQLRRLVRALHDDERTSVPHAELVRLAGNCHLNAGVTIDFEASRALGRPMVVLRTHQPTAPAAVLDVLSKREVQVVALMADGLSNKQIARRLFIALPTVKDHVHRMLKKTALSNRAALAAAFKGHTLVDRDAADSTQPPPGQPLRFGN